MADTIRWGILGPGAIAHSFANGLKVLPDAELVAVGSRAQDRADKFGDEFDVPRRHGSYEALAADPDVDVIYVATPHSGHMESTILCLNAGKAVLCEKPFCINARQAKAMIDTARAKGVFLMEAMWTRFLPGIVQVREWLAEGAIGDVQMVNADFGFGASFNIESRLFDPERGGGALLDVGVYTVAFASMVFGGAPDRIVSMAHKCESGVDERAAMIFGYDTGQLAVLVTAITMNTAHMANILGSAGRIDLPTFWRGSQATLSAGGEEKTVEFPFKGNGYEYQAIEVMECIRAGKLESDSIPLDESLAIMQTMDTVREQWGLKYPME